MNDKNPFGGGNKHSLYVPMSEIEQEALARIIQSGDCWVKIVDWGTIRDPPMAFGDARVQIPLRITFNRPEVPQPNYGFNLELWWGATLLFQEWQHTTIDNKPIMIAAGSYLDFIWDIQVARIDPKIVKQALPEVIGLTSRRTDKVTGDATFQGNMKLTEKQKGMLRLLEVGEALVRENDADRISQIKAKKKADEEQ